MQKHPEDYKQYIGYKLFFLPKAKNYKSESSSGKKERLIDFLYANDTIQIIKNGKIPYEQISLSQIFGSPKNMSRSDLSQYNERKKKYDNTIDKAITNVYMPHFFHEGTSRTDGTIYGKIGTSPDSVYGKYFTIIDIKAKEPYGSKEFKKLEDVETNGRDWQISLKFTLRNESNQDTLYWFIKQARFIEDNPFFLVPYFEKQRKMYLNKNLVLQNSNGNSSRLQNLIDVNTGAKVNINYGEVWTCSDFTFIDSKNSYYLKCYYFLKNGDKEVKISLASELIDEYFMLETEFKRQELEKQKEEEERERERLERQKKKEQERINFRNTCIAKWGQKMGSYVADGKVVLGMNKEMCIASWGSPLGKNRTIIKGLTSEQWVYGWATYLYFNNGVLSAIQD